MQNDDTKARYGRARGTLMDLVERPTSLNEIQRQEADKATRLLNDVTSALESGDVEGATRLLTDAEAALASASVTTPAPAQPAPATPPAQPAPAPSSTPTPTTTAPPAPIQPTASPAPTTTADGFSTTAGGIIAGGIIAVVAGIASIGLAVGADAIRAAAAGGIIAVIAVATIRAAAQGGGAGITAAMCTAGLAAGITAGVMKVGNVNVAALTAGSIVGTIIAVATTGGGRKMLEMARFAISSATGSNKSQH